MNNEGLAKVEHVDILIVGAGPTGLGAATRIHQLHQKWKGFRSNTKQDDTGKLLTTTTDLNVLLQQQQQHTPLINPKDISYRLVESNSSAGGLASTYCTNEKFLFDLGGHVIFSHFMYFDDLLQYAVGPFSDTTVWCVHKRESYVYMDQTFVPYPFQLHFGVLKDIDKKSKVSTRFDRCHCRTSCSRTFGCVIAG